MYMQSFKKSYGQIQFQWKYLKHDFFVYVLYIDYESTFPCTGIFLVTDRWWFHIVFVFFRVPWQKKNKKRSFLLLPLLKRSVFAIKKVKKKFGYSWQSSVFTVVGCPWHCLWGYKAFYSASSRKLIGLLALCNVWDAVMFWTLQCKSAMLHGTKDTLMPGIQRCPRCCDIQGFVISMTEACWDVCHSYDTAILAWGTVA